MLEAAIMAAVVILDQLVKTWASNGLTAAGISLLPGVIGFRYVENTGAAFSFFSNGTLFLTILSAIMAVVLIFIIYRFKKKTTRVFNICLAMIAGGAIGNLIDRLVLGYVVDMVEFQFVNFAVFNIADAFITVGAIILVLYLIVSKKGRGILNGTAKKEKGSTEDGTNE